MIGHNFEIKIDNNFDTCIFIDGKELHFIESYELSQTVQDFGTPVLKLSLAVVDPIEFSSNGKIIINKCEVDDDIALQIYELLRQKFNKES